MPDIVIQAENLGKHDATGHQAENDRDVALRDVLVNNARKLCAAPSSAPPRTCCAAKRTFESKYGIIETRTR